MDTTETKAKDKPRGQPKLPKGRPLGGSRPLPLTPDMFEQAGRCALSWRHLAGILGISIDTITERMKDPEFKKAFERGKLASQTEVIETLFAHMRNGSLKAAVFLAQAWCHLSTKHEVSHEGEITARYIVEVPPEQPSLDAWSQTYTAPPVPVPVPVPPVVDGRNGRVN